MGELITMQNGVAVLTADTAQKIADFEKIVADIKAKEEALKKAILEEMEAKRVVKLETDNLVLTYVAPTTRETLDSKTLRAELPTIYDQYCKVSTVKASVRVKVKG